MSSGSSSSSTNDSVTDSVTPASDNFQTLTLTSPPSTANPMQYMHFGSFSAHPYPTADFNSYNPAYPTPYQTAHAHAQLAANLYTNGTGNRLSLSQSHQSGLMLGSISRRKRRNLFSPSQISMLEDKFRMNKYLNAADREALAARISLSATQVKIWFQNQRYKHKRQDKERRMDGARCSNSDRDSDTDRDNDSHGSSLVCSPAIKKEEQEDQKPFMSSSVSCLPDIQQHTLPYQVGFRLNGEKKDEPLAPSVSNNELKPYASAATTGADVASCLPDFSQQSFYQMYPPAAYMNPIFTTYPPHPSSYSQASYFTGNQNL